MASSEVWTEAAAGRYDEDAAEHFAPEVLDPTVDLLSRLGAGGPVCEFAIGTGRVGVPLLERGVPVTGIELSEPMVAQLRRRVNATDLPVVVGDMATSRAPGAGSFSLVFLVWNTLSNLLTQAEQVQCFRNAARHLRPGGRFVVELWIPRPPRPGESPRVPMSDDGSHAVVDVYGDPAGQQVTSEHTRRHPDGSVTTSSGRFRYAWPAELDLMAVAAGMTLEDRFGGWDEHAFTGDDTIHVSVWRKPELPVSC